MSESFVNYPMMKDLEGARRAGVIHPNAPLDSEYEENHLSELERITRALDEAENFVYIWSVMKHRRELLIRILDYMKKEGEKNG